MDTELWDISKGLKIALKEITLRQAGKITVYSDMQLAIKQLQVTNCKKSQELKTQIYKQVRQLQTKGKEVIIRWIPNYSGIDEN